jgi:hypothetical protein
MKIGIFQKLELTKGDMDVGFDTFLYTYHYNSIDPFVFIAKNFDLDAEVKYMVALRPHIMAPQYLFKILQSFYYLNKTDESRIRIDRSEFEKSIAENRQPIPVYINLITGSLCEWQKGYGGTIQQINDHSSFEERSDHLIKFINEFNILNEKYFANFFHPNLYISTTNQFVFDEATKKNNKMIIEYLDYKNKVFNIKDKSNVIIAFGPVIRETHEDLDSIDIVTPIERVIPNSVLCTPEELTEMLKSFEEDGVEEVLFWSLDSEDTEYIYNFVRSYKEKG